MKYSEFLDEKVNFFSQDFSNKSNPKEKTILDILRTFIKILSMFHKNYDKKLNLTKFFDMLRVPIQEREDYINLVLDFQDLFHTIFNSHSLRLEIIDSNLFFTTKKSSKNSVIFSENNKTPNNITISYRDFFLLNDIIYMFTNIKRGKGFNLTDNTSKIVKGIKKLRKEHPYLFFTNGHGYVYPTEFTIKLGQKFNSYLKSNRKIENIIIQDRKITIK